MHKKILISFVGASMLLLGGCPAEDDSGGTGNNTNVDSGDDEGETEGDETGSMTTGPTSATSASSSASTTDTPTTSDTDNPSTTMPGSGFIQDPDGNSVSIECSVWDQDCPDGEKCMPWANDGGNAWNAVHCTPIADDPDAPGEPCSVEGSPVSGIDTCELGSMCWDVDPMTNEGVCIDMCSGSEAFPKCAPVDRCAITNDGVLIVCLPACSPFAADCEAEHICHPIAVDEEWVCVPAAPELAEYGQPCTDFYDCGPGLACASSQQVMGIGECGPELGGCCTAFCDLDVADGCPDAALGQVCVPFYEEGDAPPFHEDLGTCVIE